MFADLYSLMRQPKVHISEAQWQEEAQQFGKAFVAYYCNEDVTPYIHVFVYHVGYFLEHYQSIERFGNYAIEGKIAETKRTL